MLITPRPGANPDNLLTSLRNAHTSVGNLQGAGPETAFSRLMRYLNWATDTASVLRHQISDDDIDRLVLTRRYQALLGSCGTLAGTAQQRLVNGLINLEVTERIQAFEDSLTALNRLIERWSGRETFVVADSSFYIQNPDRLEVVDLHQILDLPPHWDIHLRRHHPHPPHLGNPVTRTVLPRMDLQRLRPRHHHRQPRRHRHRRPHRLPRRQPTPPRGNAPRLRTPRQRTDRHRHPRRTPRRHLAGRPSGPAGPAPLPAGRPPNPWLGFQEAPSVAWRGRRGMVGKGRWVRGAERAKLAADLKRSYESGVSIRVLAGSVGRSYGFVHRILTEAGTTMRGRGGDTRRPVGA